MKVAVPTSACLPGAAMWPGPCVLWSASSVPPSPFSMGSGMGDCTLPVNVCEKVLDWRIVEVFYQRKEITGVVLK